jgi:7-cyano-7-deazaguanine reductase
MSKINKNKSTFEPLDKRLDFDDESVIHPEIIETFPYEYPEKKLIINIETDEFTAVCPWSGLPDFATIKVNYIPGKDCIELRSFKYYLLCYRTVGIYQEHVVNKILKDLVKASKPRWMEVIADYKIRGGVHTVTSVEWGKK